MGCGWVVDGAVARVVAGRRCAPRWETVKAESTASRRAPECSRKPAPRDRTRDEVGGGVDEEGEVVHEEGVGVH
eukprot:2332404-Prymnesium_polylepis.1